MEPLFFESWQGILRTIIITTLAYISIVFFLRGSGKRTLAKMQAFDFIITIALGSSLATVSLNKNVPLAEGALVFLLLIFLQFILTWLSVRIRRVRTIVTATPSLLIYKGQMLGDIMKKERITSEDIYEKVREEGFSGIRDLDAVILETTGEMTIVPSVNTSDTAALGDVKHVPEKPA
ncbi:MAG: YetF domain-containing protein [Balneolaceae bacterium]